MGEAEAYSLDKEGRWKYCVLGSAGRYVYDLIEIRPLEVVSQS